MVYNKPTYKELEDRIRELEEVLECVGTEKAHEHKLLSSIQPDTDIGSLTLPRIIDIDVLQELQDTFANAHNVASVIFDMNGKPVTKFSNFSEFCRIIRDTEKGRKGCIKSDRRLGKKSIKGESDIEPCGNIKEIMDGVFPIIIQGRHIATWGIGQAVTGDIDEEEIRRFARKIGAEENKLVEASKKLVRMPREHFGKILGFLRIMSEHVSSFAVQNIEQAFLISQWKQAKEAVQKARDELEIRVEERTAELKWTNMQLKQEIEERRQAEEALRDAEENWRNSFNSLEDVMLIVDKDYNVENINDNGLKLLGKSKEEVIGKKCYKLIHRTDTPGEFCPLKKSLETKVVESVDRYEGLFDRHFSIKSSPIFDERGGIIRFADLMRDITDRKQAEEALQESEARYRSVFENTGTAILIIEDDMTLSMVNKEAEKLSGYSREELEGKMKWTEFVTEEDLKKMKEYHLKRRENGEPPPKKHEFRLADKQGNVKDISMNIEMIPGTKKSVASLSDITPHKRAEEQIRESLKEKEVLLQEIHHRVKNNMQVISSLINLQSEHVKDKESLEMFKESRDRILSMASIHEKLYQSEDLARIDFDDYIRSITQHLFRAYVVDPDAVRLSVNCSDVVLDINKAVPCGLIINELISNALKHAFPEGREGEITVDFHPDGDNRLTLTVSDDGVGFPEDIDISRDAKTLGLQLISILADQLKGTLEVEREGGTVFKIMFNR